MVAGRWEFFSLFFALHTYFLAVRKRLEGNDLRSYQKFWCMELNENTASKTFTIYLTYRPPKHVSTYFIHEYSSFLVEIESQILPIVFSGDFSILFDDSAKV